jgi:hypothetical protein
MHAVVVNVTINDPEAAERALREERQARLAWDFQTERRRGDSARCFGCAAGDLADQALQGRVLHDVIDPGGTSRGALRYSTDRYARAARRVYTTGLRAGQDSCAERDGWSDRERRRSSMPTSGWG